MPAIGAVECGRSVTSATTGSVVNLVPRDCILLGFYANASTTVSIYDSASTTTTTTMLAATACAVGWNDFSVALTNGLAVNQGAQLYFIVI